MSLVANLRKRFLEINGRMQEVLLAIVLPEVNVVAILQKQVSLLLALEQESINVMKMVQTEEEECRLHSLILSIGKAKDAVYDLIDQVEY